MHTPLNWPMIAQALAECRETTDPALDAALALEYLQSHTLTLAEVALDAVQYSSSSTPEEPPAPACPADPSWSGPVRIDAGGYRISWLNANRSFRCALDAAERAEASFQEALDSLSLRGIREAAEALRTARHNVRRAQSYQHLLLAWEYHAKTHTLTHLEGRWGQPLSGVVEQWFGVARVDGLPVVFYGRRICHADRASVVGDGPAIEGCPHFGDPAAYLSLEALRAEEAETSGRYERNITSWRLAETSDASV